MATTIGPSYDPAATAAALAESYVAARQNVLTTQSQRATAAASALTKLKSAISAYQTSLLSLSSTKTMLTRAATFSNTGLGTATASATAAAGSYSFFVERLATANQVQYSGLADTPAGTGTINVSLGGVAAFSVNLSTADTDANGTMTARELAAAINAAPANASKVSASVVTINGTAELILKSQATGAASAITLTTSPDTNAALQAKLAPGNATQVVAGQDARVWLGAQGTGTLITQATNTFTNIEGVSMTFTKAQAVGETPVTLTVAADNGTTTANVQKFVDEYNKLKSVVDGMISPGDPDNGKAAGAFADDGGVRVLQGRLISILRQAAPTGETMAAYGIIAARDGSLSLDATRLTKQLAINPNGLDALIGKASGVTPSGIAGNLDTYLKQWSSSVDGQIKQRQEANDRMISTLANRQNQIDKQYDSAYKRYLAQFTALQALQNQMASNTSMFDALFGSDSK
ncbi:flagellar filament capping protein FliD [Massilia sp. RP-1-19]|uniref:Flagellar hook-associated protein 2 n=1 Tax=Massilia polaris TaxID=2728846 RepID=A0A848HQD5_9BURK|nr:flagellar filament capping protein FliD [Massilia polaris]NML63324.1 flagellar filament capping protein FliD [Massilia polaris]